MPRETRFPKFEETIRKMVAEEVEAAVAPYRARLAPLLEFMAIASPATAPSLSPRGRAPGGSASENDGKIAPSAPLLSVGQQVQYRLGSRAFDATVVGFSEEGGFVRLRRKADSLVVLRPLSSIIA
jgi:sRNA-binding protein